MSYDSAPDTLAHREEINKLLVKVASELMRRGFFHDQSKLIEPEKSMFDEFRPLLDSLDVGGAEYSQALKQMGAALQHHYSENRHHPEHFENGIAGMNLVDVIEMVCDWKVSAARKGEAVNLEWAQKRFGVDEQLASVMANTLKEWEQ